jgi:hypothetical protein
MKRTPIRTLVFAGAAALALATGCKTVGTAGGAAGDAAADTARAAGNAAGTAARGAGNIIEDTAEAADREMD